MRTIHADNEFCSIFNELEDKWDIEINFSNPGEHVPDIERENRTLKERIRVAIHRLPFTVILRTMIRYLPLKITKNRSMFPRSTGISKYFAPYTILKKKQIDYKKEFSFLFGNYVQAYNQQEPKTIMFPSR